MTEKKLWAVTPEQYIPGIGHLWIVAQTIESAFKKGQEWLIKRGFKKGVKKVSFEGTIDVF